MTRMAQRITGTRTVEAVIGRRVVTDWTDLEGPSAPHVQLSNWANLIVVIPATANVLGKVANGIADDVLTSTILAADCPVVLVPVMNAVMWKKPAIRRNVRKLREDGYEVVEPRTGTSVTQGRVEVGSMGDFRAAVSSTLDRLRGLDLSVRYDESRNCLATVSDSGPESASDLSP